MAALMAAGIRVPDQMAGIFDALAQTALSVHRDVGRGAGHSGLLYAELSKRGVQQCAHYRRIANVRSEFDGYAGSANPYWRQAAR